MADDFIQIAPDGAGKKVDNSSLTVGANTVFRQRTNVSSPTDPNAIAEVKNVPPSSTDYGQLVRLVREGVSKYHKVVAGGTNAASIKSASGRLRAVRVFNNAAYPFYVKFHNTNGIPSPGNAVEETVGVQAGTQIVVRMTDDNIYTVGIGISIVKGIDDADSTGLLANDGVVDVYFI